MNYRLLLMLVMMQIPVNALAYTISPSSTSISTFPGSVELNYNLSFSSLDNSSVIVEPSIFFPYFDYVLSPSTKFFADTENYSYPIKLTLNIPQSFPAGSKDFNLVVIINKTAVNIPIHLDISQVQNFTISGNQSINAITGANINAIIYAHNIGNTDINVTVLCSKYCVQSSLTTILYRTVNTPIPIGIQIPANETGLQDIIINVSDKSSIISINVSDVELPKLNEIIFPKEIEILKPFKIQIDVSDNVKIKKVIGNVCGITKQLLLGEKYYEEDFYANNTGSCEFKIYMNDTSDNVLVVSKAIDVIPMGTLKFYEQLKVPKTRTLQETKTLLLSLADNIPFEVTVNSIEFIPKFNETIDGTPVTFRLDYFRGSASLEENKTSRIETAGDVTISIYGRIQGTYTTKLAFKFPKGVFEKEDFTSVITGEIAQYSVSPQYNGLIAGKNETCVPHDTGDYFSSYIDCTTRYYEVDMTYDSLSIPLSQKEVDSMKLSYDEKVKIQTNKADFNGTLFIIFLIISTALAFYIFYLVKMKDRISRFN